MAKYCFCVNCGARIPDTRVSSTCPMCDGDIDHEKDQLEQKRRRIEMGMKFKKGKKYMMSSGVIVYCASVDFDGLYTHQFMARSGAYYYTDENGKTNYGPWVIKFGFIPLSVWYKAVRHLWNEFEMGD